MFFCKPKCIKLSFVIRARTKHDYLNWCSNTRCCLFLALTSNSRTRISLFYRRNMLRPPGVNDSFWSRSGKEIAEKLIVKT